MSEEQIKDVIDYVESICNGICSTEEEGLEIKRYIEQLQQENKELKERINVYENPNDLTLMFMYCEEKAKDKIKELQQRIDKAIKYINKYDVFKEYSFPLMSRHTENEIKSSIDYEFNTSVKEKLLKILEGDK